MIADIVVGLQHGDEAKGKVTHHLCKDSDYTHVLRFNGGCNAGHTIYHEGRKFVTHHIPAGVFYGIKSIIGSGCVLNVKGFFKELLQLQKAGIDTSLVKIAKNCHLITQNHLEEDVKDEKIGTTKRGNGPAYTSKYKRNGIRAKDALELRPFLIDLYEEFHNNDDVRILCEGAQGFELDIDWGDYPYVTSSHCTAASALLNGTHMVLNKVDVLEKLNRWSLFHENKIKDFTTQKEMCDYIIENTPFKFNRENALFSGNKHNLSSAA
jgi:adenylosuccinate synthase